MFIYEISHRTAKCSLLYLAQKCHCPASTSVSLLFSQQVRFVPELLLERCKEMKENLGD